MAVKRVAAAAIVLIPLMIGVYTLWRPVSMSTRKPVRLSSIAGEVFHLNASAITKRGAGNVIVVRLEGPAQLVPHHYAHDKLDEPQTVEEWAEELGAPIVFNAGQFDENFKHLGWLKRDGQWIMSHRKRQWKGLLLSGPVDGGAWARIADLEQADPKVEKRYEHVIQSMMLFDDNQRTRVRSSDRTACRTVVAEDKRGRLLIIITEGAVTLADFSKWLQQTDLGIVRAMNMDGGIESQLAINTPELTAAVYGQYGTGTTVFEKGPGMIRYRIPTVIAVRRR